MLCCFVFLKCLKLVMCCDETTIICTCHVYICPFATLPPRLKSVIASHAHQQHTTHSPHSSGRKCIRLRLVGRGDCRVMFIPYRETSGMSLRVHRGENSRCLLAILLEICKAFPCSRRKNKCSGSNHCHIWWLTWQSREVSGNINSCHF